MRYACVIDLVKDLLMEDFATEGFMEKEVVKEVESRRVFGELNTGRWWVESAKLVPEDVVIVPLIFFTDGTWLSKNGAQNAQPVALTIGNFPLAVMNKHAAKRTVCYLPQIRANKIQRKKQQYKDMVREVYHGMWYAILGSVRRAQEEGGFTAEHNGR